MSKWPILKEYALTKWGRKFRTKEEVEAYQNKQIQQHMEFVCARSSFYKELFSEHSEAIRKKEWSKLPIVDKQMVMNHFDEWNTVGVTKEEAFSLALEAEETRNFSPKIGDVTVGLSSGTSGHRGLFLVSDSETLQWTGSILAKLLPGPLWQHQRIAFFLRANSNLYDSTNRGRISFQFYDLLDDFESHVERLESYQPTIVVAPPSLLRQLAYSKDKGHLRIAPTKIVSVAEVLEDIDKIYIERMFNQTLHQVYQCTEGFLATTCEKGTLHINEDMVRIEKEYLDEENGIFVPILTDFKRTSQPIIRYRLNDVLIEKKDVCPCGSPFMALERIDGRCDDLFYGEKEDGQGELVLYPDFIRRALLFASPSITEYKVMQQSMGSIEVKIKTEEGTDEQTVQTQITEELHRLWHHYGLKQPFISFSIYDLELSDKKRKRIENNMNRM